MATSMTVPPDTATWQGDVNITTISPIASTTPGIDFFPIRFGYFIGIGIIIPIGFIFNTLSIVVLMSSKNLRNSTTGLYLTALAVADNLFLIGELLRWLDTDDHVINYTFLSTSNAACQFVYSLRYGAKLTSAWITVAITSERFFIVTFPLRAVTICTKKIAKIVICVVSVVCFVLGCFPVLCIGLKPYKGELECLITDRKLYTIGNWVVLRIGSLLLPGIIVIVLTCLIIINLAKAKIMRRRTLNESRSSAAKAVDKRSSRRAVEKQLTAMLLSVATAFIALRLPYTIMFYINEYKEEIWNPLDKYFSYQIYVATKLTDIFATMNYAINFFLYCLTGSTFRLQLRILFGCEKAIVRKRKLSTSAVTHNTILSSDKISLSIIKKPHGGRSPRLDHAGDRSKETDALNNDLAGSNGDKIDQRVTPAVDDNQKQEHRKNGFSAC